MNINKHRRRFLAAALVAMTVVASLVTGVPGGTPKAHALVAGPGHLAEGDVIYQVLIDRFSNVTIQ